MLRYVTNAAFVQGDSDMSSEPVCVYIYIYVCVCDREVSSSKKSEGKIHA